jgi:hypothetical protein
VASGIGIGNFGVSPNDLNDPFSANNVVQGNYFGTDGTHLTGGNADDLVVDGQNTLIGGTTSGAGNVFCGGDRFVAGNDDLVQGVQSLPCP